MAGDGPEATQRLVTASLAVAAVPPLSEHWPRDTDSHGTARPATVVLLSDPTPGKRARMSEMTLQVEGMGCRRCVREVTARLRDVHGVQTVVADPATSTVRLTGSMTVEDVLEAFTGTRYQPRPGPNSATTETGQRSL